MSRLRVRILVILGVLAAIAVPVVAQIHHHQHAARVSDPQNCACASQPLYELPPRPLGNAGQEKVAWWLPLVEAVPTLLCFLGALPGIIAIQRGVPNWKSYFWRGIFFGFLFFPVVLILLYQVLKYEPTPITNQAQMRPPNVVIPQSAGATFVAETPPPVTFQSEAISRELRPSASRQRVKGD